LLKKTTKLLLYWVASINKDCNGRLHCLRSGMKDRFLYMLCKLYGQTKYCHTETSSLYVCEYIYGVKNIFAQVKIDNHIILAKWRKERFQIKLKTLPQLLQFKWL